MQPRSMTWRRRFAYERLPDRVFPVYSRPPANSDDAPPAQRGDFRFVVAKAPEDLVGVLAEQWCGPAVGARGVGQLDRGRGQRQRLSEPGIGDLREQVGSADVRLVECLLWGEYLARHDVGLLECRERLGAAAFGTPFAHPRRDDLGVVGARLVVGKTRIGEPMVLADHPAPAPEHRGAD